jgi:hypothetical protein
MELLSTAGATFTAAVRAIGIVHADGTYDVQFVSNRIVTASVHCDGVGSVDFTGLAALPSIGYGQIDGMATTDIWGHVEVFNPYILTHGSYPKLEDYIYGHRETSASST